MESKGARSIECVLRKSNRARRMNLRCCLQGNGDSYFAPQVVLVGRAWLS